jgi:PIN domain nuclease of toxin-antitoxin system
MLIAQAQAEGLILLSADEMIGQYQLRIHDPQK